tara:strand:+ start:461 stop:658 length:198 start_codon:yes stop_codon:yes gene_type:complete
VVVLSSAKQALTFWSETDRVSNLAIIAGKTKDTILPTIQQPTIAGFNKEALFHLQAWPVSVIVKS